eukprot:764300-Hanusia_phi.AAC.4
MGEEGGRGEQGRAKGRKREEREGDSRDKVVEGRMDGKKLRKVGKTIRGGEEEKQRTRRLQN